MIKATGTLKDGRPLYLIGLSARNLELLREGLSVQVVLEEIGGVGELVITFGETERELAREWADLIGPSTQVSGTDVIDD
jgi:hypothetical protein